NAEKVAGYIASGQAFLSHLPVSRDCVIMTVVPTVRTDASANTSSAETAAAVAQALGLPFVSPVVEGLNTFDGSHLDPPSAERWSKALLDAAAPRIRNCLGISQKSPSHSANH